jgi:RNA polymerase sigma factor for flagellar operon FliA
MKPTQSARPGPPDAAACAPTAAEITQYLPLVHQVVARFMGKLPPNVLRDDLVAAGTFGLIDSLRKNGHERGPTFEWYARIRIRGSILDELRAQDWLTRRARSKANAQNGVSILPPSKRSTVIGFDDLPGGMQGMNLSDPTSRTPLDLVEQGFDNALMAEAVSCLPERERRIVTLHYFQGIQFKEIAAEFKVSEPRISQLHTRAMGLLRDALSGTRDAA